MFVVRMMTPDILTVYRDILIKKKVLHSWLILHQKLFSEIKCHSSIQRLKLEWVQGMNYNSPF